MIKETFLSDVGELISVQKKTITNSVLSVEQIEDASLLKLNATEVMSSIEFFEDNNEPETKTTIDKFVMSIDTIKSSVLDKLLKGVPVDIDEAFADYL